VRVLPMGLGAVLVEDPPGSPVTWALGLRALASLGVVDVVPAARTVLVRCTDDEALQAITDRLDEITPVADDGVALNVVGIDVVYDGEDLGWVADRSGLSVDEIVHVHSSTAHRVAFCGFAPGFGYLTGLPPALHLPRRASPRTHVPAGSVAIAAEYSAVYPRASPGGWHLIGRTDLALFDPDRDPPALMRPGAVVHFRPVA
jgi:KipI family sensor histidine kinase inhibitor